MAATWDYQYSSWSDHYYTWDGGSVVVLAEVPAKYLGAASPVHVRDDSISVIPTPPAYVGARYQGTSAPMTSSAKSPSDLIVSALIQAQAARLGASSYVAMSKAIHVFGPTAPVIPPSPSGRPWSCLLDDPSTRGDTNVPNVLDDFSNRSIVDTDPPFFSGISGGHWGTPSDLTTDWVLVPDLGEAWIGVDQIQRVGKITYDPNRVPSQNPNGTSAGGHLSNAVSPADDEAIFSVRFRTPNVIPDGTAGSQFGSHKAVRFEFDVFSNDSLVDMIVGVVISNDLSGPGVGCVALNPFGLGADSYGGSTRLALPSWFGGAWYTLYMQRLHDGTLRAKVVEDGAPDPGWQVSEVDGGGDYGDWGGGSFVFFDIDFLSDASSDPSDIGGGDVIEMDFADIRFGLLASGSPGWGVASSAIGWAGFPVHNASIPIDTTTPGFVSGGLLVDDLSAALPVGEAGGELDHYYLLNGFFDLAPVGGQSDPVGSDTRLDYIDFRNFHYRVVIHRWEFQAVIDSTGPGADVFGFSIGAWGRRDTLDPADSLCLSTLSVLFVLDSGVPGPARVVIADSDAAPHDPVDIFGLAAPFDDLVLEIVRFTDDVGVGSTVCTVGGFPILVPFGTRPDIAALPAHNMTLAVANLYSMGAIIADISGSPRTRLSHLEIGEVDVCAVVQDPSNPTGTWGPVPDGAVVFRPQFGDPTTTLDATICELESAAMVLDWQTRGQVRVWGGELVPYCGRSTTEIRAIGTNLYNCQQAWQHWGQYLDVRTGQTWNDLLVALGEGRGVILNLTYGDLPASERCSNFAGSHGIALFPNNGMLVGDPLCRDFKYPIHESYYQVAAESFGAAAFGSSSPQKISFAVSRPWSA